MCEIRWVLRHDAIYNFKEIDIPIIYALDFQKSINSETLNKINLTLFRNIKWPIFYYFKYI
jgi:hypothetical protein